MTKSVYTQAMADNNELPGVGMEFLDSGSNLPNKVRVCIVVDDGNVVYRNGAYDYLSADLAECEPLTPPITLIDGEAYQFNTEGQSLKGIYREYNHRFYNAMGDYLVSTSTNIKHLT
jgi:hypothetical protein